MDALISAINRAGKLTSTIMRIRSCTEFSKGNWPETAS